MNPESLKNSSLPQTRHNTGTKDGSATSEKEYQERIDGGHDITTANKATVLLKSFKVKLKIILFLLFVVPIILSIALITFAMLAPQSSLSLPILNIVDFYSKTIFLGFIPEYLFGFIGPNYYTELLQKIPFSPSLDAPFVLKMVFYMWANLFISLVFSWVIYFIYSNLITREPLSSTDALGERWRKKYEKALAATNQSQGSSETLQKSIQALGDIGPFIKEVARTTNTYKEKFAAFYPVYKFFFNKQNSLAANKLAGLLNPRWEDIKNSKQNIKIDAKLFDLIDSGYEYGDTARFAIKKDIVKNIRYAFKNNKGELFHKKEELFLKKNSKFLKRNLLALLCVTSILKNQLLPPIYVYLKTKYKVEFNRSERKFISNFRKIYSEYTKHSKNFNNYKVYLVPISLQYDYPHLPTRDLSHPISVSINKMDKMLLALTGFANEIDSLLPPTENFNDIHPAFNNIFTVNIGKINQVVCEYLLDRLSYDPNVKKYAKQKENGLIYSKIEAVVQKELLDFFFQVVDLTDPNQAPEEKMLLFKDGMVKQAIVPKIKLTPIRGKNTPVLQQMSIRSYSMFKNEISIISIGYINYLMDTIYSQLGFAREIKPILTHIITKYDIYTSMDSVSLYLHEKKLELERLRE